MHAAYRYAPWIFAATIVCMLGCRGPHPFSRFVQVTPKSDANLPEIEAPPQRLATAKPRQGATAPPFADSSPHVTRTVSSRQPASSSAANETPESQAESTSSQADQVATASGTSRDQTSDEPEENGSNREAATVKTAQNASSSDNEETASQSAQADDTQTKVAKSEASTEEAEASQVAKSDQDTSESPADKESRELLAAFSDYPPEVQREALRRLVAATSRAANKTDQPHALDLAENVDQLPDLPPSSDTASEVSPSRIGVEKTASASQEAAGRKPSARVASARVGDSEVSDLVPAESDSSVVQTISDLTDRESVQPVSAAKDLEDSSMIAQAVEAAPTASGAGTLGEDALYASLIKQLSTARPNETEAQRNSRLIRLRHLMVLAGNPDDAVIGIEGMSEAEQEYLRHQLLGLWTMIDPQGHPVSSRRFTSALPQIREAAKFAAAATDSLEVRSLEFCTEIESYGQIKPFPDRKFSAGQQVILYCEVENFTVQRDGDGFETHLQGSYDIYNDRNEKVVSQLLPADQQVSANYLRDYFIAYQMHLPQQLPAGSYRLQLTMEDVNGKKYGQASVPFQVK